MEHYMQLIVSILAGLATAIPLAIKPRSSRRKSNARYLFPSYFNTNAESLKITLTILRLFSAIS